MPFVWFLFVQALIDRLEGDSLVVDTPTSCADGAPEIMRRVGETN